jgi:hypothetical protein
VDDRRLPRLPYELTWKNDFGFETLLWKVFGIEGDYEVFIAEFGAEAKRVVLGIGRNFSRGADLDPFGSLSDQVDDFSDKTWTDAKALQNFFVLVQNILGYELDKIVLFGPLVEHISTRIPARNKRLSEPRFACHEHTYVNYSPWLTFRSSRRQR